MFYLLFIIQLATLFFLSKKTTNEIFYLFRALHVEEKTIFTIVSILFLPGTILHELAHYLTATILFMKVREVKILPEFEEKEIKLGRVLYEKKDFVRGIMVGIAPFFVGVFFFWLLAFFKLFPHENLLLAIAVGYLIFAVSSTMFSSKQDLVDIVFIVPILLILGSIMYIFNIRLDWIVKNKAVLENISSFIKQVNFYFFISLGINICIIGSLKILRNIVKK